MRWRIQLLAIIGVIIILLLDFAIIEWLFGIAALSEVGIGASGRLIMLCLGAIHVAAIWGYLFGYLLGRDPGLGDPKKCLRCAFFVVASHIAIILLGAILSIVTPAEGLGIVALIPFFMFGFVAYGLAPLVVIFMASYLIARLLLKLNRSNGQWVNAET